MAWDVTTKVLFPGELDIKVASKGLKVKTVKRSQLHALECKKDNADYKQTFYGGNKARQIRPFISVLDLKGRTERTANQGLQREVFIPNFECPAKYQSVHQCQLSLYGKGKQFLHVEGKK